MVDFDTKEEHKNIEKIFGKSCSQLLKANLKKAGYTYADLMKKLEDEFGYKMNVETFKSAMRNGSLRVSVFTMILAIIDEEISGSEIKDYIRKHHKLNLSDLKNM